MIFLKGNVPSLKNSKIKTKRGIFPSKTVTRYIRSLGIQAFSSSRKVVKGYVTRPNHFKEGFEEFFKDKEITYPIIMGFHFVRSSKRSFDFNNANQILADLLTAHDFIEDDDMSHFLPVPMKMDGKYYSVDKSNPGVYIQLFKQIKLE